VSPPRASSIPAPNAVTATKERMDLRALFDAHYAATWRLLRRLGVAAAQLDDATQEVFWVCARRLSDIRPGSETSFLYGVALRIAVHETRRQRSAFLSADPNDVLLLPDHGPSPEEDLDRRQARMLLDSVLDRMPVDLRTVFVLFELEGIEVREIAGMLEMPVGTAASRLRRAREEFSAIARRVRAVLAARERSL
jgi:RNA polymerase sigma-70 factor (ECF subfamily)